jgi:hypothetical protein
MSANPTIPTKEFIEEVRVLGDVHPGYKLDERFYDEEELTEAEMHALMLYRLARFVVHIEDANEPLLYHKLPEGVLEILSMCYDNIRFAQAERDDPDATDEEATRAQGRMDELVNKMLNDVLVVYKQKGIVEFYGVAFDHLFYACVNEHSSTMRNNLWDEMVEKHPEIDDEPELPDSMLTELW